mmetsp:Transcript_13564/g.38560  ORF Transcript_13564/g.38560 Transcript_13564/m.38560 type:complete len:218 (+) Transcript_13564:73-726(+)
MGANGSMIYHEDKQIPSHQVRLAVTPIGPKMMCAYHSSIAVDDVEFCFSRAGVSNNMAWMSHKRLHGPFTVFDMGTTSTPGVALMKALGQFFTAGTYDLLRKNCNTFSDCALFYLLGYRLDPKYRMMEQVGEVADRLAIVRMLTLGSYEPNPKAEGFSVGQVLTWIGQISEPELSMAPSCYGFDTPGCYSFEAAPAAPVTSVGLERRLSFDYHMLIH